jgi:hypothetical protein
VVEHRSKVAGSGQNGLMLEKKWSKMAEIVPEIFKTDENLETGQNW